jgi:hypothetical protein
MTTKKFVKDETFHADLFEVLSGSKEPDEGELTLGEAMWWIDEYIHSSYFLAINPLPALRRILPQFRWEFRRSKEDEDLSVATDIIQESDLIWMIRGGTEVFTLVTATSSEEKPRRNAFFAGKRLKVGELVTDSNEGRLGDSLGANVIYDE